MSLRTFLRDQLVCKKCYTCLVYCVGDGEQLGRTDGGNELQKQLYTGFGAA